MAGFLEGGEGRGGRMLFYIAKFEVLAAALQWKKSCHMTPCGFVNIHEGFGEACCPNLHGGLK